MTTTTTPAGAQSVGGILEAEQLAWGRDDWANAWGDDEHDPWALHGLFERSVIWAADEAGLLADVDLMHLLQDHGFSVPQLTADLQACSDAGHPVADPRHAAQALVWLGY
jgi:hypothetical protein